MNISIFWSIIEKARQKCIHHPEKQQWEYLVDALCELPVDDIHEFARILWLKKVEAYRADVWEAASLVACGCGDDSFTDFHNWLIAQGQFVYEKTLENPDNLADFVEKKGRFDIFECWIHRTPEMAYARKTQLPHSCYTLRLFGPNAADGTQQPIPDPMYGYPYKPVLAVPLAPEDELPVKYPRIFAKFGGCDDEELFP